MPTIAPASFTRCQDADGRLAAFELRRDALAVFGAETKALVMEVTDEATANDAGKKRRRSDDGKDEADAGALLAAAAAELVPLI